MFDSRWPIISVLGYKMVACQLVDFFLFLGSLPLNRSSKNFPEGVSFPPGEFARQLDPGPSRSFCAQGVFGLPAL